MAKTLRACVLPRDSQAELLRPPTTNTFSTAGPTCPQRPVSRSISVLKAAAASFRAVAAKEHVRMTRAVICTLAGGLLQLLSL